MTIGIYAIVAVTIVINSMVQGLLSPMNQDHLMCPDKNEVYTECQAYCEPTCTNRTSRESCPIVCVPGCICMDGFIRRDGKCVSNDQCEIKCEGKNEVFGACANYACKGSCEDPLAITDCFDLNGCLPGCICQDGFLRNSRGQCVPSKTCFKCGVNETFTECNSGCQGSCSYGSGMSCGYGGECRPGCNCKEGYLKDYAIDKCVLESDCSYEKQPCSADLETLINCECAGCEKCSTLEQKIACRNLKCVLGCKDCNGCNSTKCGNSLENCGIILEENEVYNNCSTLCSPEMTCYSHMTGYQGSCSVPPQDLAIKCIPRRECKTGYVRNTETGKCVKSEACCEDPNAELVTCPNPCPGGTCEAPEFSKCKWSCNLRGCQCKKGYVKNYEDKCVLLKDCPKSDD